MELVASGAFVIDAQENEPVDFDGGALLRARWSKVLTGDIVGTSTVHLLLLQRPEGPAAYVGIEHYNVDVLGKRGSFLLLHAATMNGGDSETSWTVVPGSGSGDLVGLTGTAEITPNHEFVLRGTLPN